jgi:hypothetical protein
MRRNEKAAYAGNAGGACDEAGLLVLRSDASEGQDWRWCGNAAGLREKGNACAVER